MTPAQQRRTHHTAGPFHRSRILLAVLVVWCLLIPALSQAAPESKLWAYWTANDPASTASLDHGPWDLFLVKYVYPRKDGINRVAYDRVLPDDRAVLNKYVTNMAAETVTGLNSDEQQAYWINLYNALTVQLILNAYPVRSIRDIDISPGVFSDGPWGKALVEVEGKAVSLDDIEHRILRPIWNDPRIHYAVNCAALGCPNLGTGAFVADKLDEYLDHLARAYINNPRAVHEQSGQLILSSVYQWYVDDFGGSEDGVLRHLAVFADEPLAKILAATPSIGGYEYDWALNDTAPSKSDRLAKRGS